MSCNPHQAAFTQRRAGPARGFWAFGLISALVLVSTIARAQSLKPRVNLKQYHALVRQAVDQYDLGNYEESKVFFTEAHRVFPNARTLRGLGMVAYTMRDYVQAIPYLEDAIASKVKPLDPPLVVEARETVERARTFIGVVRVTLVPADAKLMVNASPPARAADGRLMLNPGKHEIEASAAGYQSATRLVRVEPGAALQVDLALSRETAGPVARKTEPAGEVVASMAPPRNVLLEAEPAQQSETSVAPWIVVGVSGAVAIGGGVLLGVALNDVAVVEHSKPTTDWSDVESKYQRTPALSTAGIVMIGAGIAGVAAGLTWHFLEVDESEQLGLDVSPLGMQLHGAW
jgi:hypothetical protein